jgi:DNA excision repair protein ERCC-2
LSDKRKLISVSVRELVEFVLRTGDLGSGRDFVGASRALEGSRAHRQLQRSRPAGYLAEVALSHRLETADWVLLVRGRIDGILVEPSKVILEEIKTVRGPWDGSPDPLHWAQAKVYAAIYAQQQALERLEIQLTYLDLTSETQTVFREAFAAADLWQFFQETLSLYRQWVQEQHDWRVLRDASIQSLEFPFSAYRPGQRKLVVSAYHAMQKPSRLFVEAPTGIGKTISVLYPAIKALGLGHFEKIFYLTAKTIGRAIVEKSIADLRSVGLRCRTLTLTARDKICFNNGQPCELQSCPFAIGYFDRSKAAIRAVLAREALTRPVIEEVARQHQVCPFELSLDASLWCDAIIGDYNYVFDPQVYLKRFFADEPGDYLFLIDEAHNLADRAREMFSAELDRAELSEVRGAARKEAPACAKTLEKLSRQWTALRKTAESDEGPSYADAGHLGGESRTAASGWTHRERLAAEETPWASRELPESLLSILRKFLEQAEQWLIQNRPSNLRPLLLDAYFRVLSFVRTADVFDERFLTLWDGQGRQSRLRLFCLDPSFLLQKALLRGKSAIFLSATLSPLPYFRQILGGESQDKLLQLPSPFPPENLCLLVHEQIHTHLKARASTYAEVAGAIEALVRIKRGNYLIYFPSYDYLNQVLERFRAQHPEIPTLVQTPGMAELQRESFMAAFHAERTQILVGFAVMGGIFGEGIDLVGDRLVGAVIVGVGLPQICLERNLIRAHFQENDANGFDYAYRFPGMNRVLQAVGRVIRSETDRGIVMLIDARFAEERYRQLFPAWWQPQRVGSEQEISERTATFWYPEGVPFHS